MYESQRRHLQENSSLLLENTPSKEAMTPLKAHIEAKEVKSASMQQVSLQAGLKEGKYSINRGCPLPQMTRNALRNQQR